MTSLGSVQANKSASVLFHLFVFVSVKFMRAYMEVMLEIHNTSSLGKPNWFLKMAFPNVSHPLWLGFNTFGGPAEQLKS